MFDKNKNKINEKKFRDITRDIINKEKENLKKRENTGKMVDEIIKIISDKVNKDF